jgi:apolipoprotein D and lipocalin family protein
MPAEAHQVLVRLKLFRVWSLTATLVPGIKSLATPNKFQKEDCVGTTATYALREDGKISVDNRCRKGSPDGPESTANGKAWVVDPETNARLKVQFFWPFSGDYWIIQLGDQ